MLVVSTHFSERFAPGQKEDEGIRGFRSDAVDGFSSFASVRIRWLVL